MNLIGKRIIVAGGSGHLGSALCQGLADVGAVVLNLSSGHGHFDAPNHPEGKILDWCCDLANDADGGALIEKFAVVHHGMDGLINCAGRAPRSFDTDVAGKDFMVGMTGAILPHYVATRAALRHMTAGSIINVISMWGKVAPDRRTYLDIGNEPSLSGVAASGALLSLNRYFASALAERGIRVNALIPGWFPAKRGKERSDYMAEINSRVPMGRIGQPQELVGAALFLLSDASSYMTGQELIVDGGYSCR